MNAVTVFDLDAGGEFGVYTLPPARAVVAAYLQKRGNWNTWEYVEELLNQVDEFDSALAGFRVFTLGEMTARVKVA
jgi:hypothetical protein